MSEQRDPRFQNCVHYVESLEGKVASDNAKLSPEPRIMQRFCHHGLNWLCGECWNMHQDQAVKLAESKVIIKELERERDEAKQALVIAPMSIGDMVAEESISAAEASRRLFNQRSSLESLQKKLEAAEASLSQGRALDYVDALNAELRECKASLAQAQKQRDEARANGPFTNTGKPLLGDVAQGRREGMLEAAKIAKSFYKPYNTSELPLEIAEAITKAANPVERDYYDTGHPDQPLPVDGSSPFSPKTDEVKDEFGRLQAKAIQNHGGMRPN